MQVKLDSASQYIVIAGEGNNLHRYKVQGDKIKEMYLFFQKMF